MLKAEDCCLVVVDVQGKLAQLMHEKNTLFKNVQILIKAARILKIPILWCQQCPDALGPTIPEIAELLGGLEPFDKSAFSCCGDEDFKTAITNLSRRQAILCGIETHVCIYQTARDLLAAGYDVEVVADAVSSRTLANKQIAFDRLSAEGAKPASTEMVLFDLLKTADNPDFKQVAKLIR
ncbi:MAG: hydrolase [Sedimentisphaerales bacterium]|nr:hydrolase [Sedimentisphaerales bacterium]